MLTIQNLTKSFDGFSALRNVNLAVSERGRLAVIGPNGAGKTTLFNVITGHLAPDSGDIRLRDRSISGLPPYEIVRLGLSRSFQRINVYPRLTVFENVQVAHIAHRRRQYRLFNRAAALYRAETMATLDSVGLADDHGRRADTLSYGRQKQLELAIALASEPALLLLDEPTAGMSPAETAQTIALIGRIARERNLALLFTEHDMEVVFTIADRIAVLHHGELIAEGAPDTIRAHPEVQRVYLGGAANAAA